MHHLPIWLIRIAIVAGFLALHWLAWRRKSQRAAQGGPTAGSARGMLSQADGGATNETIRDLTSGKPLTPR
jgi:hypothetical protein